MFIFPYKNCVCNHTVTVWKNEKFGLDSLKNISSNQLFSNFHSKTVTFTKYFQIVR